MGLFVPPLLARPYDRKTVRPKTDDQMQIVISREDWGIVSRPNHFANLSTLECFFLYNSDPHYAYRSYLLMGIRASKISPQGRTGIQASKISPQGRERISGLQNTCKTYFQALKHV